MENLGIVGQALKKRILEVSRRLTKEEIDFLAAQGIAQRGTGFVDSKTNKFVSNAAIDGLIADYRGKPATQVSAASTTGAATTPASTGIGNRDPVYEVVSSIDESIENLFGILTKKPTEAAMATPVTSTGEKVPEEASFLSQILKMFKKLISSTIFWITQIAMPVYETLKSAVHGLMGFIDEFKTMFSENILPFFTKTIPSLFDEIKIFFTEKIPEYFEMFMIAAKGAVASLLELPKKIILYLENYAVNFGKEILGKFEPWIKRVGIDTSAASDKLNEKQKQIQKEQADLQKQKREADEARRKAEAVVKKKYEDKRAARVAAVAAAKPATPAPKPAATPVAEPASKKKASFDAVTNKADGVDTNKLNSTLKDRVALMAEDYYQKTGKKLLITSGYRSTEKQKELWDEELARQGGNVAKARKKVAPPPPIGAGSRHSSGLAIDINSKGDNGINALAGDRTQSTGWLEQFGLVRPVAKENWHIQLAGDAPSPDNPVEPGEPTIIPGSRKILGDGRPKDVTAQYKAQVDKRGSATTLSASPVKVSDLILPERPVADALHTASKKVGVDLSLLYAMAKQESGFNPNAVSKGTGAKGLFQFVNNTWSGMLKQYQSSFPELHKGPLDPIANAIAGALYLKENIGALARKKIPINATNLYAAHFLGAYGASKLLSAKDTVIAASILPAAASSNKNIFYADNNKPRTVGEVIQILYGKVGKYADQYAAVVSPMSGTQVASATRAADIRPPKTAAMSPVQTTTPQTIKTAATSKTNDYVPNIAAVVRGYKAYFALS